MIAITVPLIAATLIIPFIALWLTVALGLAIGAMCTKSWAEDDLKRAETALNRGTSIPHHHKERAAEARENIARDNALLQNPFAWPLRGTAALYTAITDARNDRENR